MRRPVIVLGAVAAVAIGAAVVLTVRAGGGDGPEPAARAWLSAWSDGRLDELPAMAAEPAPDLVEAHQQMDDALRVASRRVVLDAVDQRGGQATAGFTARLELTGLGTWSYRGTLPLVRRDGEWKVAWRLEILHPEHRPGLRFTRERLWSDRAPILGAGGAVLAAPGDVVTIGVEPRRIGDRAAVAAALEETVGLDAAAVDRALARPGVQPDHFVPLVDVRPERYAEVRPTLHPIPGIVFRRATARLSPTDDFAAHVIGRVGEVTAERLEELGSPYQVGDRVGLTGLEAVLERHLAGRPSGEIRLVDEADNVSAVLRKFPGVPPQSATTTIDPAVQAAAEQALDGVAGPGALVAVDTATGAVRAAVSRPLDEGFNRALAGRYPPGSTFKIVTTTGLLGAGVTADTPVECPAEAVVGGKRFRNFESEALGTIPFRQAFAHSCNTAFVQLAAEAGAGMLSAVAETYGFGTTYDLPLRTHSGEFPEPADEAELAAAAIGQGRVTASPLHMATVAGAVAAGSWRAPHLLAGSTATASPTLSVETAESTALAELMAAVVRSGTGTAAAVPGREVAGKTGTAEFGDEVPPRTHAWFVGYSGELAFAVLIEDGGVGGEVAAPVAARFLAGL